MDAKRIFIALDISDAARRVCADHIQTLRTTFGDVRVGWERPEKIHLTMKFLGKVDAGVLAQLLDAIRDVAENKPPFQLKLSSPGVFPSRTRPRVIWIGLSDISGSGLGKTQSEVELACSQLGSKIDDRRFRPHLTIGRLREPQRSAELVDLHLQMQIEPVEFEVGEIVVYESRLQATGSVYSVIGAVPLGR